MLDATIVGRELEVQYTVESDDLVTFYDEQYPEVPKLRVLTTSKLSLWMARGCMLVLGDLSVGQDYEIRHRGIAVLGATVWVKVKCVWFGGRHQTRWTMTSRTQFGPLASGQVVMRQVDRKAMEWLITRQEEDLAMQQPAPLPTRHELPEWAQREATRERLSWDPLTRGVLLGEVP